MQVNHASGYIEKKMEIDTWFLILQMTTKSYYKNKDVWSRIKNKIDAINSGECDYEKDFMKIKFNSDHDLPWETIKISYNDYNYQICFWRRW